MQNGHDRTEHLRRFLLVYPDISFFVKFFSVFEKFARKFWDFLLLTYTGDIG